MSIDPKIQVQLWIIIGGYSRSEIAYEHAMPMFQVPAFAIHVGIPWSNHLFFFFNLEIKIFYDHQ